MKDNLLVYLEEIKIDDLKEFTNQAINQYSNKEKILEANNVCKTIIEMLKHKKLLSENSHQSFVDVLISASLLHNIFFDSKNYKDGDEFINLFKAREVLTPLAKKINIPDTAYNAIFQCIEGQLGANTPIPLCLPGPDSPTDMFSWAVWFAKK